MEGLLRSFLRGTLYAGISYGAAPAAVLGSACIGECNSP